MFTASFLKIFSFLTGLIPSFILSTLGYIAGFFVFFVFLAYVIILFFAFLEYIK